MKYFCVGIKGSGMSTLASILYDLGNDVSGYDDNINHSYTEDGLIKRNIKIFYNQDHDIDPDTIVTYSKAFSDTHPELQKLKSLNLKFIEYNELLGELTKLFETICVSGTHGKTTTSLMISNILKNTIGTNYFVGDGSGFASRLNKTFVIESCEFKRHFLAYHPHTTIITNIELEHTECYNGIEDIRNTFNILANRSKLVIACGDDENIKKLNIEPKCLYYGLDSKNDIYAKNIKMGEFGSTFEVIYDEKNLGEFAITLTGNHMILNSLAAILVCLNYNIKIDDIKKYLKEFVSPKRRFKETIVGNNVVIDDYAHHPTELKVTIQAARAKYPNKKIIAIFKPNTYSRTKALKDDFIKALKNADKVYLTEIDCNREKKEDYPNISSKMIVDQINNGEIINENNIENLLKYENVCLLFMSCANIYTMKDLYIKMKSNS